MAAGDETSRAAPSTELEHLAPLPELTRVPPLPEQRVPGDGFWRWFGRALVCAVPSALFAALLGLSGAQWLLLLGVIALWAKALSSLSLRLCDHPGWFARVVGRLRVAVWARLGWLGVAFVTASLWRAEPGLVQIVLSAPLMSEMFLGGVLADKAGLTAGIDGAPPPVDPGIAWLGSWVAPPLIALLIGAVIAAELGFLALVLVGIDRLRARRAARTA